MEAKKATELSLAGSGLLVTVVCAASLLGRPGITAATPAALYLCLGILAVAVSLLHLLGAARVSTAQLPCLLLPVWVGVCAVSPLDDHLGKMFFAAVIGFSAVSVAVRDYAGGAARRWSHLVAVLLGLLALSLASGLLDCWQSGERLKSNFTNPDCYCVLMLFGYFFSQSLLLESAGLKRVLLVVLLLLFYAGIFLTGSRAGWAGLVLGSGVLFFTLWASRPLKEKVNVVLSVALPLLTLLISIPFAGEKLVKRFTSLQHEDRTGFQTRLDVATYGLRTARRYWLTGAGGGCFHLAYQQDRPESSRGEGYMNVAHNDPMQWAVETGAPGLALWAVAFAWAALAGWRKHRAPPGRVAGSLGFLVAYWVYSLFNFASPVPADLVWLAAGLGLTMAIPESSRSGAQSREWSLKPYWILFLLAGLYTVSQGWIEIGNARSRHEAAEFQAELNWEPAYHALEKAVARQPEDAALRLQISECAQKLFFFTGKVQWLQASQRQLLEAVKFSPRDLDLEVALAENLSSGRRYQDARLILDQCERWAPTNNMVQRALARNSIFLGRFQEAFQHICALSSSQSAQDRTAMCELLLALEARKEGEGLKLLSAFVAVDPDNFEQVARECGKLASSQKRFPLAVPFYQLAARWRPNDREVHYELAQALGDAGRLLEKEVLLSQLREQMELSEDDPLVPKVWQAWAETQLAMGKNKLVAAKLEEYLLHRPRDNWPRILLARRLEAMGRKADARSMLREGVSYDEDGSLRVQLGDMCLRHQLYVIARNYYVDALPLVPNKEVVRAKIAEVQRLGQKEEDMMLDEPASPVQQNPQD